MTVLDKELLKEALTGILIGIGLSLVTMGGLYVLIDLIKGVMG
jgi:hypothetical protein